MEENLKPTTEILNIFRRVQLLFKKDMSTFTEKFAEQINVTINDKYSIDITKTSKIICEDIILRRGRKIFTLRFLEMKDLENIGNKVTYHIDIYIENEDADMIYYRWLEGRYYLTITDREYINSLFPKDYITSRENVDGSKVLEYVHQYLNALKVMLAEEDFQKILYDPEFWVYANPYK